MSSNYFIELVELVGSRASVRIKHNSGPQPFSEIIGEWAQQTSARQRDDKYALVRLYRELLDATPRRFGFTDDYGIACAAFNRLQQVAINDLKRALREAPGMSGLEFMDELDEIKHDCRALVEEATAAKPRHHGAGAGATADSSNYFKELSEKVARLGSVRIKHNSDPQPFSETIGEWAQQTSARQQEDKYALVRLYRELLDATSRRFGFTDDYDKACAAFNRRQQATINDLKRALREAPGRSGLELMEELDEIKHDCRALVEEATAAKPRHHGAGAGATAVSSNYFVDLLEKVDRRVSIGEQAYWSPQRFSEIIVEWAQQTSARQQEDKYALVRLYRELLDATSRRFGFTDDYDKACAAFNRLQQVAINDLKRALREAPGMSGLEFMVALDEIKHDCRALVEEATAMSRAAAPQELKSACTTPVRQAHECAGVAPMMRRDHVLGDMKPPA